MRDVRIGGVTVGNDRPLVLIAGPCQIESADHAQMMAGRLVEIARAAGCGLIFKASFDKANRTSHGAARGVGMDRGLAILSGIRDSLGVPVLTDVHEPGQCAEAAGAVDVLQIPAFLCRQTDLLIAAAHTGAAVNVKKGQFLAPWDMAAVAAKLTAAGAERILLTERGASFGYNALVADMRSLPVMAETGWPVVMDATHAVQSPGGLGGASGGDGRFAPVLARAAVAVGVAAVFLETHEVPDRAPSDGPVMIPLDRMPAVLDDLQALDRVAKARSVTP